MEIALMLNLYVTDIFIAIYYFIKTIIEWNAYIYHILKLSNCCSMSNA